MFRKLTDRISSAASSVMAGLGSEDQEKVQRLTALGFDQNQAVNALQATQGNVDQAAELLLTQQVPSATAAAAAAPQQSAPAAPPQQQQQQHRPTTAAQEEEQLQRAMQESYDLMAVNNNNNNNHNNKNNKSKAPPAASTWNQNRTAAMHKAAEAAARRAQGGGETYGTNKISKSKATTTTTARAANNNTLYTTPSGGANNNNILRSSGGLSKHHPDVKVIPKLQDKSKEEQVMRCTFRLKSYPAAVDTLLRALTAVQKDPYSNPKFRTIKKSTAGYQRSLHNVPGALDLLLAMNYRHASQTSHQDALVLDIGQVDPALLYLGVSALEQTKLTPEYIQAKRRVEFAKTMAQIRASGDSSEEEALRRAAFLQKCPTEPSEGRGALLQVILGPTSTSSNITDEKVSSNHGNNSSGNNTPTTETLRRRFDGDDTLDDVVHWLGAHGSGIVDKLKSGEWILRDLNRYPMAPLDITKQGPYTLQYVGLFPSGRLDIVPSE